MSLLAAATVLALTACGGGDESDPAASGPAPVQVDSSRIARATLDATGGSINATAADGRRYTLTVPPGALSAATEITATPVVSMGSAPLAGGLRGAVRFGPAGLSFAVPAILRIEGAGGSAPPGSKLVGFVRSSDGSSMQLVPPVVVEGALQMELRHFSDAGVSQATAQEIAQVPVDTAAGAVDALVDEYMRDVSPDTSPVSLLIRLHDSRVAPRLTAAESAGVTGVAESEVAVAVAQAWFAMVKISFETDLPDVSLPDGLGAVASALRQRVLELITRDFDFALAVCVEPGSVALARGEAVRVALLAERQVAGFRNFGGLPGLDPEAVKRRLNDCVRVVFVPRTPPTFEVGRPVSLDAQAQLVFAADPNAAFESSGPGAFAFSVTSEDGTIATPTGLAAADGTYTTVVTPRIADPAFGVEACVVPSFDLLPSVLCGSQTIRGAAVAPVLAGEVQFFATSISAPPVSIGSARVRLRAELDGSFTVLEASGSTQRTITSTVSCAPFPADGTPRRDITLNTLRTATITGGVQNAFLNAGQFIGFTLTGTFVETTDRLQLDCSVIVETTTSTTAGAMQILEVQRDAQGQPLALVMGDSQGSHQGRLERE